MESSLTDLFTSCEFVDKALTHGSDTEVLLVKKQASFEGPSLEFGLESNALLFSQVEDRLVQYGQMEVVREPAENNYLVFHPGECPIERGRESRNEC